MNFLTLLKHAILFKCGNLLETGKTQTTLPLIKYHKAKYIFAFLAFTSLLVNSFTGYAQVSEEWVARYHAHSYDFATSMAVDVEGNIYVTGHSVKSGTGYDFTTVRYNAAGEEQWVARYHANIYDYTSSMAIDAEGNIYVTGYTNGGETGYDYATVKYNALGVQQWSARYNGSANSSDIASSITVDAEGSVYVTGYSDGGGTSDDYATVKYNASGTQLWVARYNGPVNSSDIASSIAVDADGNIYVTGYSNGGETDYDYATVKYNTSGEELWVERYDGTANKFDQANSMAIDAEGNIYVTGYSNGGETDYDYATVKYNASGEELWVARYNGPGNRDDQANSMEVDPEGNVYITGRSWGSGTGYDYATIKYNSSGTQQWAARYNDPNNGYDQASSVSVEAKGNVYVTGRSWGGGTSGDYATVKYNTSGEEQWVERYNGPGNWHDHASSMAVDSEGNVYVTGRSWGSGTYDDYATVKYTEDACFGNDVPVIVNITAPNNPIQINTSFSVSASFNDDNLSTASWDWGDGSTSAGAVTASEITGSHSYDIPGVFTVTLSVKDACGESANLEYQYIVAYDPDGGFVTGGGWIYSPAGAYEGDPAAEGKASFGFVAKYKKGTDVPDGNTEFQFKAGGLDFKSTDYEWLVIAGHKAMYKGSGTINGFSGYGFQLSAVDGDRKGNGEPDRIRMKIWNRNNVVVYDNQMGDDDDTEATMALEGGSIVIHDGKKKNSYSRMAYNEDGIEPMTGFSVYPNPISKEGLWLEFPAVEREQDLQVFILDMQGRRMAEKQFKAEKAGSKQLWKIEHSNWSNGIYLLVFRGNDMIVQKKLVK